MEFSSKIFFIFYILLKISNSNEKLKENYKNFNKKIIENSDLFIKNNLDFNNDTSIDIPIDEAIKLFPISYLAYIIRGFLPNIIINRNNNETILESVIKHDCFNYYEKNQTMLNDMIKYSGKSYPDFGEEDGCIRNGYAFLLFCIYFEKHEQKSKYKLIKFISSGYSFYGLCINNEEICTNNLTEHVKKSINKNSLTNSSLYLDVFINKPNSGKYIENDTKKQISKALIISTISYVLIKIIVSIVGSIFFKEVDLKKNSDSSSSEEEEEEEEGQENSNNQNKKEENQSLEQRNEEEMLIPSKKEIYPKFYIFYKFCSYTVAVKYLFQKNGDFYQESDLYLILFFRFINLLLNSLYMNIYLMVLTPSKEINHTTFFENFFISLVKLSSFSNIVFILCESILAAYKLMSFIRKYTEKNKEPSFKLFFNFFLRIIPSFMTTFLIFFAVYYFKGEILYILMDEKDFNKTRLKHLIYNLVKCYSCINDKKSLIPFYMHYKNLGEEVFKFKECMQFMLVMINMFYCYLLVILLIYISFRLKNKKFEYAVVIIYIINFLLPNNLSCASSTDRILNINLLLGETDSIKITHLFINYYFLGFLIGLSIFYNNDITQENSFINSSLYKPFYFLEDIIKYVYLMSFPLKLIIIIFSLLVQMILSVSFYIYVQKGLKDIIENEDNDYKKYTWFDNFIYLNEKKIYIIFFSLMLIILYTFKNESLIKGICNNMLSVIFNRIAYGYYALTEDSINLFYCFIEIETLVSTLNIIFITIGMIFLDLLFVFIFVLLLEIPIKFITKKFLQIKNKEIKIM